MIAISANANMLGCLMNSILLRRLPLHASLKMFYSRCMLWVAFLGGLILGGLAVALWMRTRIVELETAKRFSDEASAKLGDTFQALADAALRSNQSAFLDAARSTLETARVEMAGQMSQKQTAIEGIVRPLSDSLGRLE